MRLGWTVLIVAPLLCFSETEEEALFLRRIADFWQEGEYKIVKNQVEEFISDYPESEFSDPLCAALGDLYLREKNFSQALNYYSKIQTPEFASRVFLSRMQCLYEMQWYATLADECQARLEQEEDLHTTYFLAIALYHQCLNAAQEPEALMGFAERAKPLFEKLFASELSEDVAQGYAHLCFILKDYQKAADIYLDLAKLDQEACEEMQFQAALIQSEFDKSAAFKTFSSVAFKGGKKSREAFFYRLALAFDLGLYEDVIKEDLTNIAQEKQQTASLLVGRSLLALKRYPEAIKMFEEFLDQETTSDTHRAALLSLLEASSQSSHLKSLESAIEKLAKQYPSDPELPKAYFSRAQILKQNGLIADAKEQLRELLLHFSEFPQKPQALFELAHLGYREKKWQDCYETTEKFLQQYPEHELLRFAYRYHLSSLAELAKSKAALHPILIEKLEAFLEMPIDQEERDQWTLLLAKTYYEMKQYDKVFSFLRNSPNDRLLAAFCYRDADGDLKKFSELAQAALAEGADLIDPNQVHFALFNAHLELAEQVEAAEHLYAVFESGLEIKTENLFWLSDLYYSRLSEEESDFALANRAAALLEEIQKKTHGAVETSLIPSEESLYKLAKVYSILGRTNEAISLLSEKKDLRAQLILAESYAKQGESNKACELFDAVVKNAGSLRKPEAASAALQSAMLKLLEPNTDKDQIAVQLKNIALQKNFYGEPVYLESAMEYIELQAGADPSKKIALLNKAKHDFEATEDLLSKDYHEAREKSSRKNQMYQGYMQLMDAISCMAMAEIDKNHRKDLHTKAKELLLQIITEQQAAPLLKRARMYLTQADELDSK